MSHKIGDGRQGFQTNETIASIRSLPRRGDHPFSFGFNGQCDRAYAFKVFPFDVIRSICICATHVRENRPMGASLGVGAYTRTHRPPTRVMLFPISTQPQPTRQTTQLEPSPHPDPPTSVGASYAQKAPSQTWISHQFVTLSAQPPTRTSDIYLASTARPRFADLLWHRTDKARTARQAACAD
jgi:hypothetical protein